MDYEEIPVGVELDSGWRPIFSSPTYRKRQVVLTTAACLLAAGFAGGAYCLWDYMLGCNLCFWSAMRFWAVGIATIALCIWLLLYGIRYCFSYASPRGIYVILAAYLITAGAYCLYTFGLPSIDLMVWKVFIAIPGFFVIPALIADGVINLTQYFCVDWHSKTTKAERGW